MVRGRIFNTYSTSHHRAELIAINEHALFAAVFLDTAGDHLDRHADLDGLLAQVGQLGRDSGAFFQFDQRDGIGQAAFKTGRGVVHDRVGIDFAFAAEAEGFLGLAAAFGADITGWKDLGLAVRADLADQSIALFL